MTVTTVQHEKVSIRKEKVYKVIKNNPNVRLTSKKKAVLDVIIAAQDHLTIEEIYDKLRKQGVDIGIATIYRTVKYLEEQRIVRKHEFLYNNAPKYEIAEDILSHHDHLIDIDTGEIVEFFDEELEKFKHLVAKKMGYHLIDHTLHLYCKKSSTGSKK